MCVLGCCSAKEFQHVGPWREADRPLLHWQSDSQLAGSLWFYGPMAARAEVGMEGGYAGKAFICGGLIGTDAGLLLQDGLR